MPFNRHLSRRDFIKLAGAGLGGLALRPFDRILKPLPQFPAGQTLGRVSVFPYYFSTELKASPHAFAATIRNLGEDEVVTWNREVIGTTTNFSLTNQTWVETPEGYVFKPHLQLVRNEPNVPLTSLPEGKSGFWAEVTVPYVDLVMDNPPPRSPSYKYVIDLGQTPRLYYKQIVWIDQIKTGDGGRVLYRFNEDPGHGYGYGDILWGDGSAFRPLTEADTSPLSPDVDPAEKLIEVNLTYQTMSAFEAGREVYFCRVSTGIGDYATPKGDQYVHWKIYSINMSSSSTASGSGYDTSGVSWPSFINGQGVAFHAAFWHNYFGQTRSHGCINMLPEDAQWVFRWTAPHVSMEQSEIRMTWPNVGTKVTVMERLY